MKNWKVRLLNWLAKTLKIGLTAYDPKDLLQIKNGLYRIHEVDSKPFLLDERHRLDWLEFMSQSKDKLSFVDYCTKQYVEHACKDVNIDLMKRRAYEIFTYQEPNQHFPTIHARFRFLVRIEEDVRGWEFVTLDKESNSGMVVQRYPT